MTKRNVSVENTSKKIQKMTFFFFSFLFLPFWMEFFLDGNLFLVFGNSTWRPMLEPKTPFGIPWTPVDTKPLTTSFVSSNPPKTKPPRRLCNLPGSTHFWICDSNFDCFLGKNAFLYGNLPQHSGLEVEFIRLHNWMTALKIFHRKWRCPLQCPSSDPAGGVGWGPSPCCS